MSKQHAPRRQQSQRGVAAIEFALVFTVVFAVLWSMVAYVAPLIVLQGMHRATAEGARVGAMYTNVALRGSQAQLATIDELRKIPISWLGGGTYESLVTANCADESDVDHPRRCRLTVRVEVTNYNTKAPLRPFTLPGLGQVPALPRNLASQVELVLN